jgi:hypothetical protein
MFPAISTKWSDATKKPSPTSTQETGKEAEKGLAGKTEQYMKPE